MSDSVADPLSFSNVRERRWYKHSGFSSQTAYVATAFVAIAALVAIFAPHFLSTGNLLNTSKNFSYIAIVALGSTLVIITGGIDLSVGSTMALVAVVTTIVMKALAGTAVAAVPYLGITLAVVCGLGLAAFIGLINGLLIAKVRLSPFVTTLGMLSICRGATYVITQGRGQAPGGPQVNTFYAVTDGRLFGLPVALVYVLVLALIMGVVLRHTRWGRYVFVLGGNERAAKLTGVSVSRVKISVYVLCAMSAGLAGILIAGWLGSAPANLALGYELKIIAASVIGGADLAGGVGGPVGAVIGAALIEVIRNGLALFGADTYWEQVFVGTIIILAVLVDRLRSREPE
ncbi:ABC transporter permease [Lichenihabitans sp. Uapishka_5]|uniref:ABC transporter permease n=1 Tax=Lichenihabitans sp. Uapishka_5 TaxID=3037302 RepID=UPI0029E8281A|nr:ABC transporter permease [Lichenihabitans sp. Uapishka_5]MDX7949830.1 ABC transporter permease [Lichenihabitans sp. Uapishka_5]